MLWNNRRKTNDPLFFRDCMKGDEGETKKIGGSVNLMVSHRCRTAPETKTLRYVNDIYHIFFAIFQSHQNFYKSEVNKEDMYIRYIHKLCDLHLQAEDFTGDLTLCALEIQLYLERNYLKTKGNKWSIGDFSKAHLWCEEQPGRLDVARCCYLNYICFFFSILVFTKPDVWSCSSVRLSQPLFSCTHFGHFYRLFISKGIWGRIDTAEIRSVVAAGKLCHCLHIKRCG